MSNATTRCARAALISLLLMTGLTAPVRAALIYFGVSDEWPQLVASPTEWTYVQQHADGFYVNYLMLDRAAGNSDGDSQLLLAKTCRLFSNHAAYIESDMRPAEATLATEQRDIEMLHAAGCRVEFSSLNYGWSAQRANNLTHFDLQANEGRRLNFEQIGAWSLNGNISGPSSKSTPGYNALVRQDLLASDGISTDGPLGYWAGNVSQIQPASLSLVDYAHQHGRAAVIMMSPYGAGVPLQVYDATKDILSTGEQEVRYFESRLEIPDIWAISQYATNLTPVPEQRGAMPADTISGLAYWLIHHVHDPDRLARLSLARTGSGAGPGPGPAEGPTNLVLRNSSTWLDVAPLLHLSVRRASNYAVALLLDGHDVTAQASTPGGLALTGAYALYPGTHYDLAIAVTRNGAPAGERPVLSDGHPVTGALPAAELTLAPNPGAPNEIHQTLSFPL